jgi:hypothetical protein
VLIVDIVDHKRGFLQKHRDEVSRVQRASTAL